MKKFMLVIPLLLMFTNASTGNPNDLPEKSGRYSKDQNHSETLPENYQQFKYQMLRLNNKQNQPPIFNFNRGTDFTMLYVAGGLLAVTSTFLFLNGYNNEGGYFTESNTGILIGGGFSTTIFITKFIMDNTG